MDQKIHLALQANRWMSLTLLRDHSFSTACEAESAGFTWRLYQYFKWHLTEEVGRKFEVMSVFSVEFTLSFFLSWPFCHGHLRIRAHLVGHQGKPDCFWLFWGKKNKSERNENLMVWQTVMKSKIIYHEGMKSKIIYHEESTRTTSNKSRQATG